MTTTSHSLNDRTVQIGKALFAEIHKERESVTSMNKWTQEIVGWCMSNPDVKARVLRFVDVLPSLKTDKAITEHIRAYFSPTESRLPLALRSGAAITQTPFTGRAISKITEHITQDVARQFICASTASEAIEKISALEKNGMSASLDILGEAITSDQEADQYQNAVLGLIKDLPPGKNISIKLSALTAHFDPLPFENTISDVLTRLHKIVLAAKEKHIFIFIDAEQYAYRDLTFEITKRLLQMPGIQGTSHVGLVLQAYLKDAPETIQHFVEHLRHTKQPLTIRLVKGAYWDSEVAHAKAQGWPIPVLTEKDHTDAQFESLTEYLMDQRDIIRVAIASHNIRSIAHAMALQEESNFSKETLEFQLLYGMADPLKNVLVKRGHYVRVYCPFGPLIPGMAYLVRRILENTSNESFLRMDMEHACDEDELLQAPTSGPSPSHSSQPSSLSLEDFKNEPLLDFSQAKVRTAFEAALNKVQSKQGEHYRLTVNGHKIETAQKRPSLNPAAPDQVVGHLYRAEWKDAEEAIQIAQEAQKQWQNQPTEKRAACLTRAADIIRDLRMDMAAWEVVEAGKTWREADADVTEAIDFLEYYSRAMLSIEKTSQAHQVPGEQNELMYVARGVAAVIAPWNFPLAILTGMTSAALVTGNAVIVKPAESTGVIASLLIDILIDAGVPPGVIHFVPGSGAEIGNGLVTHPQVDLIAFTGSKEIGLSIVQKAGQTLQDQQNVKKVIAEMGGKNAIIIDDDADFDEAVLGVVGSAFGYQGQKCSACSRLIILDSVYDSFLKRLVQATQSLKTGNPMQAHIDLGPIIDVGAYEKIQTLINIGKREARLIFQGQIEPGSGGGYFIAPTIFADSPLDGVLAQEEIFGPVLTVFKANDFDEALMLANMTSFALTGGIYTRNPDHIELARQHFDVGNLYINRKITGAMVGRQPFGGSQMSGLGSKAGGMQYLHHFMFQKTTSENTFRHGFPL